MTTLSSDGDTLRIHIPIALKRKQSRKMIVSPSGQDIMGALNSQKDNRDYTLIKAVGKAFLWQSMLDNGTYPHARALAVAEGVEVTHVSRILRLTLLAPDIVESIVQGRQSRTLTLQKLIRGFPVDWGEQRYIF